MSMGTVSPLYQPFDDEMLERLAGHYPSIGLQNVTRITEIMTDHLRTETLLMVAICDMLDRQLRGVYDEGDQRRQTQASGILLSAIARSGTYKVQTEQMKLLHDVLVELQMAGRNFARLQRFLQAEYGVQVVTMHSCGSAIVACNRVDSYYDTAAPEQLQRTTLDWTSVARRVTAEQAVASANYTLRQLNEVQHICDVAGVLVGFTEQDGSANPQQTPLAVVA